MDDIALPSREACTRCVLATDGAADRPWTLHVAPVLETTGQLLTTLASEHGLEHTAQPHRNVAIHFPPGRLDSFVTAVGERLGTPELRASPSLLAPPGVTPNLVDLGGVESLAQLVGRVRGRWLEALLRESRLTIHFQPIVHAADAQRVFAHECLVRGVDVDGSLVPPGRMFAAAAESGLLFVLDRAARLAAIQAVATHAGPSVAFVNFTPNAVYDPQTCLRTTVAAITVAGLAPEQIVFEVTESEEAHDPEHLAALLAYYRRSNFRVALDDLGAGYASLGLLTRLRPDFVKIDRDLVRGVHDDPYRARVLEQILALCQRLDVRSIAEGVEDAAEFAWLREHGADFVQGFLIARPASPPPRPHLQPERGDIA